MYQVNRDMAEKHNREFEHGEQNFKMTLNKFADLTEEELLATSFISKTTGRKSTMQVRKKKLFRKSQSWHYFKLVLSRKQYRYHYS